jgi:hypothetical protein
LTGIDNAAIIRGTGEPAVEGKKPIRTQFAMKALDMSEMFQVTFGDFRLSGGVSRRPELTVPEGQSTGGGAKAVQSITLIPEDAAAGVLVAGTVNGAANTAELRGYPYLEATYKMRFHGKRLDIPMGSYQKFLEQAKTFLENHAYKVSVVNQLPDAAKRHYDQNVKQSGGNAFWIVLGFLVLAGAGVAAFLLLAQ